MKLKLKNNAETREFLASLEQATREVDRWPAWMSGKPECGKRPRPVPPRCILAQGHGGKCVYRKETK